MVSVYVYIDTNVFLDFYQSALDRLAIFQQLVERAESVVLTEQTIKEFNRNRAATLIQLAANVERSSKVNIHTTAIVREIPDFQGWLECRDKAHQHAASIVKQLRDWAADESRDLVFTEFEKLSKSALQLKTTPESIEKAKLRKVLGEPPTSPDKHTIGDELIWETLLQQCSTDLILVSRDKTFTTNESILAAEFALNGKRRLLSVTEHLGDALKQIGKPSVTISEAEEKRELDKAEDAKAIATGRCPRCECDLEETGYEGSDGDEAWWLYCPKCNREYFPSSA